MKRCRFFIGFLFLLTLSSQFVLCDELSLVLSEQLKKYPLKPSNQKPKIKDSPDVMIYVSSDAEICGKHIVALAAKYTKDVLFEIVIKTNGALMEDIELNRFAPTEDDLSVKLILCKRGDSVEVKFIDQKGPHQVQLHEVFKMNLLDDLEFAKYIWGKIKSSCMLAHANRLQDCKIYRLMDLRKLEDLDASIIDSQSFVKIKEFLQKDFRIILIENPADQTVADANLVLLKEGSATRLYIETNKEFLPKHVVIEINNMGELQDFRSSFKDLLHYEINEYWVVYAKPDCKSLIKKCLENACYDDAYLFYVELFHYCDNFFGAYDCNYINYFQIHDHKKRTVEHKISMEKILHLEALRYAKMGQYFTATIMNKSHGRTLQLGTMLEHLSIDNAALAYETRRGLIRKFIMLFGMEAFIGNSSFFYGTRTQEKNGLLIIGYEEWVSLGDIFSTPDDRDLYAKKIVSLYFKPDQETFAKLALLSEHKDEYIRRYANVILEQPNFKKVLQREREKPQRALAEKQRKEKREEGRLKAVEEFEAYLDVACVQEYNGKPINELKLEKAKVVQYLDKLRVEILLFQNETCLVHTGQTYRNLLFEKIHSLKRNDPANIEMFLLEFGALDKLYQAYKNKLTSSDSTRFFITAIISMIGYAQSSVDPLNKKRALDVVYSFYEKEIFVLKDAEKVRWDSNLASFVETIGGLKYQDDYLLKINKIYDQLNAIYKKNNGCLKSIERIKYVIDQESKRTSSVKPELSSRFDHEKLFDTEMLNKEYDLNYRYKFINSTIFFVNNRLLQIGYIEKEKNVIQLFQVGLDLKDKKFIDYKVSDLMETSVLRYGRIREDAVAGLYKEKYLIALEENTIWFLPVAPDLKLKKFDMSEKGLENRNSSILLKGDSVYFNAQRGKHSEIVLLKVNVNTLEMMELFSSKTVSSINLDGRAYIQEMFFQNQKIYLLLGTKIEKKKSWGVYLCELVEERADRIEPLFETKSNGYFQLTSKDLFVSYDSKLYRYRIAKNSIAEEMSLNDQVGRSSKFIYFSDGVLTCDHIFINNLNLYWLPFDNKKSYEVYPEKFETFYGFIKTEMGLLLRNKDGVFLYPNIKD